MFTHFHSINTPTVPYFKLPMLCHWRGIGNKCVQSALFPPYEQMQSSSCISLQWAKICSEKTGSKLNVSHPLPLPVSTYISSLTQSHRRSWGYLQSHHEGSIHLFVNQLPKGTPLPNDQFSNFLVSGHLSTLKNYWWPQITFVYVIYIQQDAVNTQAAPGKGECYG